MMDCQCIKLTWELQLAQSTAARLDLQRHAACFLCGAEPWMTSFDPELFPSRTQARTCDANVAFGILNGVGSRCSWILDKMFCQHGKGKFDPKIWEMCAQGRARMRCCIIGAS